MLDKLTALVKEFIRRAEPIDPAKFGDEIATKTEWTPAVGGGASFGTHKLRKVPPDRLAFTATLGAQLFAWIFILAGLLVPVLLLLIPPETDSSRIEMILISLVFTVPFTGAGLFVRSRLCKPRAFDRRSRAFWKGRKDLGTVARKEDLEDYVPLERIHALQIIKEYCSGSKGGGYYSYELNLILDDASRVNVVDHGNIEQLRLDTAQLAEFLGDLPVWDASV